MLLIAVLFHKIENNSQICEISTISVGGIKFSGGFGTKPVFFVLAKIARSIHDSRLKYMISYMVLISGAFVSRFVSVHLTNSQ